MRAGWICDECCARHVTSGQMKPHGAIFGPNETKWSVTDCVVCERLDDCVYRPDIPDPRPVVPEMFYLQDARGSGVVGNCMLWWAKGRNGYVCDIREAHVFTRDAAIAQNEMRSTDKPWHKDYIDNKIQHHVDIQSCHWMASMETNQPEISTGSWPNLSVHIRNDLDGKPSGYGLMISDAGAISICKDGKPIHTSSDGMVPTGPATMTVTKLGDRVEVDVSGKKTYSFERKTPETDQSNSIGGEDENL